MRYLLILVALAACSTQGVTDTTAMRAATSPSLSAGAAVEHSLTGSGVQKIAPGFEYAMSGAIHSDASGRVWGTLTTRIIDLSAYGYAGTAEIEQTPTCLRIDGNTAYAGLVVTRSTDTQLAPVGSLSVIWMRDGGPGAPDVGHGGPAPLFDPTNAICTSTPPAMPADAVTSGNFVVR